MKPTPDGFIYISQSGPVVADDEQLELRRESEEILPHEPGGDRISAGATAPVGEAEAVLCRPCSQKRKPSEAILRRGQRTGAQPIQRCLIGTIPFVTRFGLPPYCLAPGLRRPADFVSPLTLPRLLRAGLFFTPIADGPGP